MVDKTFRPENFEKGSNREKGKEVRSYETGSSSRSGAEREKGKGVEKDYSSGSGLSKRDKSITEILCEKQIKAAKQLKNGSDFTDQAPNVSASQDHTSIREMQISEQEENIIECTRGLPIREQRTIWEKWINTLNEKYISQKTLVMNSYLLDRARSNIMKQAYKLGIREDRTRLEQRADIIDKVRELPISERRSAWEKWINTLDGRYRAQETCEMNNILPEIQQIQPNPQSPVEHNFTEQHVSSQEAGDSGERQQKYKVRKALLKEVIEKLRIVPNQLDSFVLEQGLTLSDRIVPL